MEKNRSKMTQPQTLEDLKNLILLKHPCQFSPLEYQKVIFYQQEVINNLLLIIESIQKEPFK